MLGQWVEMVLGQTSESEDVVVRTFVRGAALFRRGGEGEGWKTKAGSHPHVRSRSERICAHGAGRKQN